MLQLTLLLGLLTSAVVGQEFTAKCFNPFPFQHIKHPDGFYSLNFTANDDVSLLVYPMDIQNTNIPHHTAMIPYDHDVNSGWNGTFRLCLKEDADCAISDIGKFHVEWYNDEDTPAKGDHAGDSALQGGKEDLERLRAEQEKKVMNVFLKAGEKAVYELPKYDTYCFTYYDYNNKWDELEEQGLPQSIEYKFYKSFSGLSYNGYTALMSSIASVVISIGLGLYIRYYVTPKASKDERTLVPFKVFMRLLALDALSKTSMLANLLYLDSHDVRPNSTDAFALHLLHTIGAVIRILKFNLIYQFVAFNKPDIFKFNDASKHKITLMTFALMLFSRFIYIHGIFHSSTFYNFINSRWFQSFLRVSYGLQCYWKSQITEHTIVNNQKKYARCFKISRIVLIPLIPVLKIAGFVLKIFVPALIFFFSILDEEDAIEDTVHPLIHLFYFSLGMIVMCLANLDAFFYPIIITISLKIWGSLLIEDTSNDSIEMNPILSDGAQ